MKLFSSVSLTAVMLLTCCASSRAQHAPVHSSQTGNVIGYQTCDHNCQSGQCDDGSCHCCLNKIRLYPDAGWNPPVNYPVNHNWAWYANTMPGTLYGNPGGGFTAQYPVVAQPTDTTQLGYYYHKVPTWQPRPDMIPPVPDPTQFHARTCTTCGNGCFHKMHMAATTPSVVAVPTVQTAATQAAPARTVRPASSTRGTKPAVRQAKTSGFRLPNLFD